MNRSFEGDRSPAPLPDQRREAGPRPPLSRRPSPWELAAAGVAGATASLLNAHNAWGQELPDRPQTTIEAPAEDFRVAEDNAATLGREMQGLETATAMVAHHLESPTHHRPDLAAVMNRASNGIRIATTFEQRLRQGTAGAIPEEDVRAASRTFHEVTDIGSNRADTQATVESIHEALESQEISPDDARRLTHCVVANNPSVYGHPYGDLRTDTGRYQAGFRQIDLRRVLTDNEINLLSASIDATAAQPGDQDPVRGSEVRASGVIRYRDFVRMYTQVAHTGSVNQNSWQRIMPFALRQNPSLTRAAYDQMTATVDVKVPLVLVSFFQSEEAEAQRLSGGNQPQETTAAPGFTLRRTMNALRNYDPPRHYDQQAEAPREGTDPLSRTMATADSYDQSGPVQERTSHHNRHGRHDRQNNRRPHHRHGQ